MIREASVLSQKMIKSDKTYTNIATKVQKKNIGYLSSNNKMLFHRYDFLIAILDVQLRYLP